MTFLDFCIAQNHLKMCIWAPRGAAELGKGDLFSTSVFGIDFGSLFGSSWGHSFSGLLGPIFGSWVPFWTFFGSMFAFHFSMFPIGFALFDLWMQHLDPGPADCALRD